MGHYPFSVSRINQMVSLIITFGWVIMLLKEMGGSAFLENCAFKTWYKTAVGIAIICLSFFVIRCCKGFVAKLPKDGSSNGKRKNKCPWLEEKLKEFFYMSHKDRNGKEIYYFWNYSSDKNTSSGNGEKQKQTN